MWGRSDNGLYVRDAGGTDQTATLSTVMLASKNPELSFTKRAFVAFLPGNLIFLFLVVDVLPEHLPHPSQAQPFLSRFETVRACGSLSGGSARSAR
jgi:hypothetical protein